MKKILLLLMICSISSITARIGCYRYDHYGKQHFVNCLCDCDSKSKPTCMWCGHYHEAPNRQIVVTSNTTPTQQVTITVPLSVEKALKNMALDYKNSHHN